MGVAAVATYCSGAVTDSFGNVFIAGQTGGGLDGNALTGSKDVYLTKYSAQGVRQWTKQLGVASGTVTLSDLVIDSSGRLYISGSTDRGLDFNSLIGKSDAFLSQYIGN
jgi:hypothetical protein